jgi:TetR/AcrR family transcriptional regulator
LDDQTKQSRKEIEKESRKADIIDTAAQLFSQKGFHDVKMDEIAERVGLSKGTIYLYFENKEALFFSIIQVRFSELTEQMQEILLLNEPFIENLKRFVTAFLGFLEKQQAFFKILHSEKMRMNIEDHYKMHDYGIEAYQTIFRITGELMRRGQEEGVLRRDLPNTLSKILLGILDAYIFQRVFLGAKARIEDEVDQAIDYFLNGAKVR